MKHKYQYFLFLLFVLLIIDQTFASPIQFTDIYSESEFRDILNRYYKKSEVPKSVYFVYTINDQGKMITKNIRYRDVVVGDIAELTPEVINPNTESLAVSAEFKKVYFLKKSILNSQKDTINKLREYYNSLPFKSSDNFNNKDILLDKILLPITKEKIIDFMHSKGVSNPDGVFDILVNNKILVEYPLILEINCKFIGNTETLSQNLNFKIKFTPEFINPVKPITGNILFKKEPIKITSKYSLPDPECKTNPNLNSCYITTRDVLQFNVGEYTTPEIIARDNKIRDLLNNFNVVSDFQDQSFEDINTKELLVDLSLTREHFCFRKDNDEYTDTIFRVAKAYDLSLEQAFQLWSLISELSNCNNNLNPKYFGFAQIDLSGRDSGNLINIEQVTSKQTTTISNTLPLQLAEEEQFQYLALGDFKEINTHLLNNVYNGNKNKFYNLGYNGIINNDNGYFGFLINAIKKNKDDFSSTVLFASDYIKELNYLIKNSREKSTKPFVFEDFIIESPVNINSIYVLASLSNNNNEYKEKIYSVGNHSKIFASTSFFQKEGNYIKSTKEVRVLINYLAIKRKYFRDPQYFLKYNLSTGLSSSKLGAYEKLDHKYWDTKKNVYLKTLEDKNIKLMLKKDLGHYNYDKLLLVPAKANYPVKYVMDFGQNTYVNGFQNYLNPGAHAWAFDTKKGAIDNYNLIWEASDVCVGKSVCEENAFTGKNCCKENKEVQDGKTYYQYIDILVDGAIIGIYNPTSKYNDENREYTHLAIYIGKTITGLPLIAESTVDGQKISILTKDIRNRVKRIYVPKNTNIKNIKDVILNPDIYPKTYINLTNAQLIQLEKISQDRKSKTDYYEDPNNIGEGDIEYLEQNEFSQKIAERARHYANLGTKYIFGGRNGYKLDGGFQLKKGIDCVGLLYVVMRDLGYIDGSTSCKEIFENDCTIADFIEPVKKKDSDLRKGHILGIVGTIETRADLDKLQSGDLLFLHTKYYFGHAGIYDKKLPNGNHQYIHASGPGAPAKVTYNTLEEKLNSGALKLPFHYGRITLIDMSNVDCSSNYISYYKRKLDCCQVTDYCKFYK